MGCSVVSKTAKTLRRFVILAVCISYIVQKLIFLCTTGNNKPIKIGQKFTVNDFFKKTFPPTWWYTKR